jgi:hypothetical protein
MNIPLRRQQMKISAHARYTMKDIYRLVRKRCPSCNKNLYFVNWSRYCNLYCTGCKFKIFFFKGDGGIRLDCIEWEDFAAYYIEEPISYWLWGNDDHAVRIPGEPKVNVKQFLKKAKQLALLV